jgi:hypothetical protein
MDEWPEKPATRQQVLIVNDLADRSGQQTGQHGWMLGGRGRKGNAVFAGESGKGFEPTSAFECRGPGYLQRLPHRPGKDHAPEFIHRNNGFHFK